MAEQPYKYWAFISYSHQDKAWASWLHRALETYRVPRRLIGREHWSGEVPRRLLPIFRDRDELSSSAELGTVLNEALRQSRYLIVICSPQAANSRWVNEEIKTFKAMGRAARVLPIIVGGEPDVSHIADRAALECLPHALRFEVDSNGELSDRRAEPIAADARGGQDGRRNARLKLIAGLIGVGLDELKQRERQRQMLQRFVTTAAVAGLSVLAAFGWRWQQSEKNQALEAQALKVRIEQLYERGRQELLAHNEARAAVLLNEAYKLGVDTPALRFMLARSMRTVDAQQLRVQTGSAAVNVAINREGSRFLTFGDNKLRAWEVQTGKELFKYAFEEDTAAVFARFSPNGKWIIVDTKGSDDDVPRLRILNAANGQLSANLRRGGPYRRVFAEPVDDEDQLVTYVNQDRSIAVDEIAGPRLQSLAGEYSVARFCRGQKRIVVGTEHGYVSLYDPVKGSVTKQFSQMKGAVVAVSSSAHCRTIAAGTDRGEIRLWSAESGDVLITGGHPQPIIDVQLSSDGARLVSQTRGGINVWDGETGALLYANKFYDFDAVISAVSPEGEALASIADSRLSITDPLRWEELFTLDGHLGAARVFSFGATDTQMISAGSDGSAILWRLPPKLGEELRIDGSSDAHSFGEPNPVQAIFNHRGDAIFYAGAQGASQMRGLYQWNVPAVRPEGIVSALAFSVDDRIVAIGQKDGKLCLRDAPSGQLISEWSSLSGAVRDLSFNKDGDVLAVVLQNKDMHSQLIKVPEGKVLREFELEWPKAQAFEPDSNRYAMGSGGRIKMVDVRKQTELWTTQLPLIDGEGTEVSVLAFSPNGQWLLVAQPRRHAFLLNVADGSVAHEIDTPLADGIYAAAVNNHGTVALGDFGKAIFLWTPTEKTLSPLVGHTGAVRAVSFSPQGEFLLSAGADGVAKVWDVSRRELLDTRKIHNGAANWYGATFSNRGDAVLIGGTDGTAQLLKFERESRRADDIAALLRCRVGWQVVGAELVPAPPRMEGCTAR